MTESEIRERLEQIKHEKKHLWARHHRLEMWQVQNRQELATLDNQIQRLVAEQCQLWEQLEISTGPSAGASNAAAVCG